MCKKKRLRIVLWSLGKFRRIHVLKAIAGSRKIRIEKETLVSKSASL